MASGDMPASRSWCHQKANGTMLPPSRILRIGISPMLIARGTSAMAGSPMLINPPLRRRAGYQSTQEPARSPPTQIQLPFKTRRATCFGGQAPAAYSCCHPITKPMDTCFPRFARASARAGSFRKGKSPQRNACLHPLWFPTSGQFMKKKGRKTFPDFRC